MYIFIPVQSPWFWFAATLVTVYLLWVFFVAVMRLRDVRDAGQLTPVTWTLGSITLVICAILDIAVNRVVMSILLWEFPRWFDTVSARLTRKTRNVPDHSTWSYKLCFAIRTLFLDNVDSRGVHTG